MLKANFHQGQKYTSKEEQGQSNSENNRMMLWSIRYIITFFREKKISREETIIIILFAR